MVRMKNFYESRNQSFLTRRTPVILRIDGKAFHTYCKNLIKPFDEGLIEDMQQTAIYLCQNIQGAKCAYTQSDEISILVTDYADLNTQAWVDYNVQKMVSHSAAMFVEAFLKLRLKRAIKDEKWKTIDELLNLKEWNKHQLCDSRVFNIPKEEVANYFYARQKDATKNSIYQLAFSLYSHKELHGKNGSEMQEMCFQKAHNWNDLHWSKKRGSFIVKNTYVNDKLAFVENDNPKIGDIWYDPNKEPLFEAYKSEHKGRLYIWDYVDEDKFYNPDWVFAKIEKIRHKWEVVETPLKFNHEHFKQ